MKPAGNGCRMGMRPKPREETRMDREDKKRFIKDLTADVAEELIDKIPQMPESWDGMEIRELLAQKFVDSCLMSRGVENRRQFKGRLSEFRNEVIVRNL